MAINVNNDDCNSYDDSTNNATIVTGYRNDENNNNNIILSIPHIYIPTTPPYTSPTSSKRIRS